MAVISTDIGADISAFISNYTTSENNAMFVQNYLKLAVKQDALG